MWRDEVAECQDQRDERGQQQADEQDGHIALQERGAGELRWGGRCGLIHRALSFYTRAIERVAWRGLGLCGVRPHDREDGVGTGAGVGCNRLFQAPYGFLEAGIATGMSRGGRPDHPREGRGAPGRSVPAGSPAFHHISISLSCHDVPYGDVIPL